MKRFNRRRKIIDVSGVKYEVAADKHYNNPPKKMANHSKQHEDDFNYCILLHSSEDVGKSKYIIFEDDNLEASGVARNKYYKAITESNVADVWSRGSGALEEEDA